MDRLEKRIRALALAGSAGKLSKLMRQRYYSALENFCIPFLPEELETMDSCGLRLLVDHGLDLTSWLQQRPQQFIERMRAVGRLNAPCVFYVDSYMQPLCYAIHVQEIDLVEQLLQAGVDPNQPDPWGRTPLAVAISCQSLESVRTLAKYGAKPELFQLIRGSIRYKYKGSNALAFTRDMVLGNAVSWDNDEEMMSELAKMGADVNVRNENGVTALHLAAEVNQAGVVQVLLALPGADPSLRDLQGRLALELTDSAHVQHLLIQAGSPLPVEYRTRKELSLGALREADGMQGVIFPFGFGINETLACADLRHADLSRTLITLEQIDQLSDLTGILLPAALEITPEQARERGILPEQMASVLRVGEARDRFGAPCRLLRAARRLIVYRRVHSLHALPEGEALENIDLRALSGTLTLEMLLRYKRFSGVIFPRGMDLRENAERFFGERDFLYCDFSEVDAFPADVWALARKLYGARLPPGIDFQKISFIGCDLSDTDFSLQFSFQQA